MALPERPYSGRARRGGWWVVGGPFVPRPLPFPAMLVPVLYSTGIESEMLGGMRFGALDSNRVLHPVDYLSVIDIPALENVLRRILHAGGMFRWKRTCQRA